MALVPFDLERPCSTGYHTCEKAFSRGSTTLPPQGDGASAFQFSGYLLFMHAPFDAEPPNLTW